MTTPRIARRAPDWKRTLAAIAGLAALTIVFYWKLCLTNEYVWFDHPDMCYIELPRLQFQAREFHLGHFPLWAPFQWLGQPLIGQAQPGPLYPFNILLYFLTLKDGLLDFRLLNWYFVLTRFLAALFAFALCRDLRLSRAASLVAAVAFGFGGFIGSVAWLDVVNGAIWTPLICLFFLRAARGVRPIGNAALCGAFLGLTWFSGHHEIPMLVGLAVGVAWIYTAWRRRWQALAPALTTFVVMGLVGAAQIWPTFEYALLSKRWVGMHDPVGFGERIPYIIPATYSLPARDLLGVFLHTGRSQADSAAFLGVMIVVLAAYAVMTCWRIPPVRWFFALCLLAALYAMGAMTPLHGVLYTLVPGLGKARIPVRAIHLLNFGIAVMAAYGFDRLIRNQGDPLLRRMAVLLSIGGGVLLAASLIVRPDLNEGVVLAGLAALATAAILTGWNRAKLSQAWLVGAVLLLIFVELNGVMTRTFANRFDKESNKFVQSLQDFNDVAEFLRQQPGPRRVAVNDTDIPTNFGDWYGIDALEGYSAGVSLNLLRLERHLPRVQDMLGVTHYLGRQPNRPDQVELFAGAKGVNVYRNPTALPRVWSVHSAQAVPSDDFLRLAMQDSSFNPRQSALMIGATPDLETCSGDTVELLARSSNRVRVRAQMKCRGLVVLSENYYPGWRATVDSAETPVVEAFGALRAVVVPAGDHHINFEYHPMSVYGGGALTLAGVAITGLLALWPAKKARAAPPSHERYLTAAR